MKFTRRTLRCYDSHQSRTSQSAASFCYERRRLCAQWVEKRMVLEKSWQGAADANES